MKRKNEKKISNENLGGMHVVLNPTTPEEILRKLVKDEDSDVRVVPAGESSKKKTP